ncbi:MAG: baseplate J/gp47 family protein [Hyphomicrobiaceae bacterium]
MPWPIPALRSRRLQVRDDIAQHLPGADASQPNSVLRVVGDTQAALTHDNDQHLAWLARMMMPDTAEGEYAERWASIWLPEGRKPAIAASGQVTVAGDVGAVVQTGAELVTTAIDATGARREIRYEVVAGVTLAGSSGVVDVWALTPGAVGNLDEGAQLSFSNVPDGIDGQATVAAPGLAGGADIEPIVDLIARYIARIQQPPHGGAAHDYVAWALEVPGVTRAWAAREMGAGTITVRFMMDEVRASGGGFPEAEDVALVQAYIDALRPVTVAECYVLAPIAQALDLTIDDLVGDTPAVRANIALEIAEILRAKASPGQIIYASWIREAISAATGEDHHDIALANTTPASLGHLIVLGDVTYA